MLRKYDIILLYNRNKCKSKANKIQKKDEKTGKIIYEGEFKDDKPVGKFKYYYPNDSVRALVYFRPAGGAYAKLFHMGGRRMAEGKYLTKEIKDSVWTYYDEAGILLSREGYKNGKKEGAAYVYFPDGKISEERFFKNDLQEGDFKQYFDDKRVRVKGSYTKGQMHGRVVYYYPNGTEAAAGNYTNGQKSGAWIYKSKEGKITEKELYINGKLADEKETKAFFDKNKLPENKPPAAKSATVAPQKTVQKPKSR